MVPGGLTEKNSYGATPPRNPELNQAGFCALYSHFGFGTSGRHLLRGCPTSGWPRPNPALFFYIALPGSTLSARSSGFNHPHRTMGRWRRAGSLPIWAQRPQNSHPWNRRAPARLFPSQSSQYWDLQKVWWAAFRKRSGCTGSLGLHHLIRQAADVGPLVIQAGAGGGLYFRPQRRLRGQQLVHGLQYPFGMLALPSNQRVTE